MRLSAGVEVSEITQHNHVWQFSDGQDIYFLKTFTKSWYGDDVARTAFCVRHEHDSYACLAAHGLPTPEVILAKSDMDNPLGRPFIVTRKLEGESLMTHLKTADARQFQPLLEKTGDYMRRMHAISFAFPGYITGEGPTAPPDENGWQHPCWSAKKTQQEALAALEADRPRLSVEIVAQLDELFSTMPEALAEVFQPPHFVQANCHAHQFYLSQAVDGWQVSGCIDMEVASTGCYLYDLVAFAIEMAAFFPATTNWWQPFFQGYGREPDFGLFKLIMLGLPEICFKIYGETRWPGTRQQILSRLLEALNWQELFNVSFG
jgi:aminoglycoside phosphotransferase